MIITMENIKTISRSHKKILLIKHTSLTVLKKLDSISQFAYIDFHLSDNLSVPPTVTGRTCYTNCAAFRRCYHKQ